MQDGAPLQCGPGGQGAAIAAADAAAVLFQTYSVSGALQGLSSSAARVGPSRGIYRV